jgi:AraC-like DNA-binding protein
LRTKQRGRFYLKLLFFCFLLASLPVLLLGIISYGKSAQVVRMKVSEQKALSLRQTQLGVEETLKVADQAMSHFFSSRLMVSVLSEPLRPDQFQLYNQVRTELTNMQRLDTGIEEVRVWSVAGNWMITNEGLSRLDAWTQSHPEVRIPELAEVTVHRSPGDGEEGCGSYLLLQKGLPLTAYSSLGMATVKIPACRLNEVFTAEEQKEPLYLFDDQGELILQSGNTNAQLNAVVGQTAGELARADGKPFVLKAGNERYTVNYLISEYNGWTYVSAVSLNELNQSSREIGWFTFYICLGLLMLFILLAYLGSKKLYRPIGNIVKQVMAGQPPSGRGASGDELAFIGEQVHVLFDAKKSLEERLSGQGELLRSFFMIRLFLGGLKEEEVTERLQEYGLNANLSSFCVVAVQTGNLQETRFTEKDRDLLLFAVNNIIGELIPAGRRLEPTVLGRTQLTVITASGADNLEEEVYRIAKRIVDTHAGLLELPVAVGISLAHSGASFIPQAHDEAVEALQRRAAFGNQPVIRFADLGESHALHDRYPRRLQEELFQSIKLLEREQSETLALTLLGQIREAYPVLYDRQFQYVRLLVNLLALANSIARQAVPPEQQQLLIDQLFALDKEDAAARWFMEKMIGPLLDHMEEQSEVRHMAIAKEMVRMVHEEYDSDLTLDTCADRLHYQSGYAGTIFRSCMGMTFVAYLARHRHQVALQWLKETDMPVKDIAARLQYNNPQNFIRSFRKVEGVSPGKYRDRQTDGSDRDAANGEEVE